MAFQFGAFWLERLMTWGDVQLHMEADGTEYLEYFERQTKTRTGAEPRILRAVNEGFRSTKRST